MTQLNLAAQFHHFQRQHPLRRCVIAGHAWAYLDAGVGDCPLVLLPGGFGTAYTSWQCIAALHQQTRVIALHYPPGLATMADLTDGLAALVARLGVERARVLGGSASGLVAQVLVRRHPAFVAQLILAQSGAPRPERAIAARWCAAVCQRLPLPLLYGLLRVAIHAFLPGGGPERAFWRGHFGTVLAAQRRLALVNRFRLAADFDAKYRFSPGDLADWPGRVVILESVADRMIAAGERATLRALYPAARVILLEGRHGDSVERLAAQIAALRAVLAYPGG
jgi:pimeloyl-ACP methyl ester carboxylesterase